MRRFQFNQNKRQTVYESDQIRTTFVQLAGNPHLRYQEKIILCRIIEINDFDIDSLERTMFVANLRLYTVFDEFIYLMVRVYQTCRRAIASKFGQSLRYCLLRRIRIKLFKC